MNLITVVSFGFFLIIFLWVGALAAKSTQDTDSDYLLANRSFGKYLIGLSAGATTNSGFYNDRDGGVWILYRNIGSFNNSRLFFGGFNFLEPFPPIG